jgi:hypothetical protein
MFPFQHQSAKLKISPSLKECHIPHFVKFSKWIYKALFKKDHEYIFIQNSIILAGLFNWFKFKDRISIYCRILEKHWPLISNNFNSKCILYCYSNCDKSNKCIHSIENFIIIHINLQNKTHCTKAILIN